MEDVDIRAEYRPLVQQKENSFIAQALAIALGTFVGVSGAGVAVYHYWQWDLKRQLVQATRANQARLAELKAQQEAESNARNKSEALRRNALRQAQQTCNFWQDEYRKNPSSYNATMRQSACARASALR